MTPETVMEEYDKIYADFMHHRDYQVFTMHVVALFSALRTSWAVEGIEKEEK